MLHSLADCYVDCSETDFDSFRSIVFNLIFSALLLQTTLSLSRSLFQGRTPKYKETHKSSQA